MNWNSEELFRFIFFEPSCAFHFASCAVTGCRKGSRWRLISLNSTRMNCKPRRETFAELNDMMRHRFHVCWPVSPFIFCFLASFIRKQFHNRMEHSSKLRDSEAIYYRNRVMHIMQIESEHFPSSYRSWIIFDESIPLVGDNASGNVQSSQQRRWLNAM